MAARYAIYLAPPPDTPLWAFGSLVLGYDAATGRDVPGFSIAGMSEAEWSACVARPRGYGFHATLKAPFRLAAEQTVDGLEQAMAALASRHRRFDSGPLAVTALTQGNTGFVALTLQRPPPELAALEIDAVQQLDRFRAPLTAEEWDARQPTRLSQRQRESLMRWGYPYVGPDYLFHMTLSGATDRPAQLADALADCYARHVGSAHMMVDALVLFHQPAPSQRFRIMVRVPLAG